MRILKPFARQIVSNLIRPEEAVVFSETKPETKNALKRITKSDRMRAMEFAAAKGWKNEVIQMRGTAIIASGSLLDDDLCIAAILGGSITVFNELLNWVNPVRPAVLMMMAFLCNRVEMVATLQSYCGHDLPPNELMGKRRIFRPPNDITSYGYKWTTPPFDSQKRIGSQLRIDTLVQNWRTHWIHLEVFDAIQSNRTQEAKEWFATGVRCYEEAFAASLLINVKTARYWLLRYFAYSGHIKLVNGWGGPRLTIRNNLKLSRNRGTAFHTVFGVKVPDWYDVLY